MTSAMSVKNDIEFIARTLKPLNKRISYLKWLTETNQYIVDQFPKGGMPESLFLATEDWEQRMHATRWEIRTLFDKLFKYEQPR